MTVARNDESDPQGFRFVLAMILVPALVQACFCTSWVPFVRTMIAIVVMVLLVAVIRYVVLLYG
jgi:hypothetical protein